MSRSTIAGGHVFEPRGLHVDAGVVHQEVGATRSWSNDLARSMIGASSDVHDVGRSGATGLLDDRGGLRAPDSLLSKTASRARRPEQAMRIGGLLRVPVVEAGCQRREVDVDDSGVVVVMSQELSLVPCELRLAKG